MELLECLYAYPPFQFWTRPLNQGCLIWPQALQHTLIFIWFVLKLWALLKPGPQQAEFSVHLVWIHSQKVCCQAWLLLTLQCPIYLEKNLNIIFNWKWYYFSIGVNLRIGVIIALGASFCFPFPASPFPASLLLFLFFFSTSINSFGVPLKRHPEFP